MTDDPFTLNALTGCPDKRSGTDVIIGNNDICTQNPEPYEASKVTELTQSVASTFDNNNFLINKTTGTTNKSVGLTREEVIDLLPKIQKFLTQADAS